MTEKAPARHDDGKGRQRVGNGEQWTGEVLDDLPAIVNSAPNGPISAVARPVPVLGKGITAEKAAKWTALMQKSLLPSEASLALVKINNFKPMVDLLLITDYRILAFTTTGMAQRVEILHSSGAPRNIEVKTVVAVLTMTDAGGSLMRLKIQDKSDAEVVESAFSKIDELGHNAAAAAEKAAADEKAAAEKAAADEKAAAEKAAEAERKAAAKEERAANKQNRLAKGEIDSFTVLSIYRDGTFTTSGILGLGSESAHDRLISFEHDADSMRRKSVTGRGFAALTTKGLSLVAASNNRGVVYVTIMGEKSGVRTYKTRNPANSVLTSIRTLQIAADEVTKPTRSPEATDVSSPNVMDQIRKLADLHTAGVLTDEEFASKKTELLGRI